MNVIQAVTLGFLQGITEFLPISSSGHLVIGQKLFGIEKAPILFDILLHLGTLSAILFYFNKKILKFFKEPKSIKLIIVGTAPAVFFGLFLNPHIEKIFNSLTAVGLSLVVTSAFLFSTKFIKRCDKDFNKLNLFDAVIIGCFQALAIFPGVSRSGSTTAAGLWQGLKRKKAFEFSFFLAIPAILGAVTLHAKEFINNDCGLTAGLIGFVTAAISGFLALKIFEKVILKGRLFYFGVYCFLLGSIIIVVKLLNCAI